MLNTLLLFIRITTTAYSSSCLLRLLRNDTASSPLSINLRFLRLIVGNQQVSGLIIAMWHLVRDLNDVERVCSLVEDFIHFLERTVCGLGEEEIDAWDHEGVDDGKDDVGFVADVCKSGWGDHDDHELHGGLAEVLMRDDRWCLR